LPVRVGGLMVNTSDLLHGDANGVTNIPPEIANEIPDAATEFIAAEEVMLEYVKAPGPKEQAEFDRRRKEFQNLVAALTKRVSRKASK
ncbi:MAG TPA: RraA family protein, partial [Pirellulaceae bacterium]|nr:RraA family protein [Pirellulaceae bacterium]